MTISRKSIIQSWTIVLMCAVIFAFNACTATTGPVSVDLDNGQTALQIKGKVTKVSKSRNLLVVKPPSSAKITFNLLDSTVYEDAESIESIDRDMGVIVTYTEGKDGNSALVVKKLPDGSCG